jgi:hypothetical protein
VGKRKTINVQPTGPAGIWLGATAILGRPVRADEPYPCLCGYRKGRTGWEKTSLPCKTAGEHTCPCYGRPKRVNAACCGGRLRVVT